MLQGVLAGLLMVQVFLKMLHQGEKLLSVGWSLICSNGCRGRWSKIWDESQPKSWLWRSPLVDGRVSHCNHANLSGWWSLFPQMALCCWCTDLIDSNNNGKIDKRQEDLMYKTLKRTLKIHREGASTICFRCYSGCLSRMPCLPSPLMVRRRGVL